MASAALRWYVVVLTLCVLPAVALPPPITMSVKPSIISAAAAREGVDLTVNINNAFFSQEVVQALVAAHPAAEVPGSVLLAYGAGEDELSAALRVGAAAVTVVEVGNAQSVNTVARLRFVCPGCFSSQRTDAVALQIAFLTPAFDFSNFTALRNVPITVEFAVEPEQHELRDVRRLLTGGLGLGSLVAAIAGRDSHTALLSLGRMSLGGRVLECSDDLDFVLHPTQVKVGSSRSFGALMTNLSIVIALMVVHATVLRQLRGVISPYLPGDHLLVVLTLFCGITISAMETVLWTEAPMRWSLALLILLAFYLAIAGAFVLTTASSLTVFDAAKLRWGHRVDGAFIQRWRVMFAPYRGAAARRYFMVELVAAGGIAVAAAFPRGDCRQPAIAVFTVTLLDFAVLLAMRPYCAKRDLAFAVVLKLIELTVAGESFVASFSPEVNSPATFAGNVSLMAGAGVVFVKYMVTLVLRLTRRGDRTERDAVSSRYTARRDSLTAASDESEDDDDDLSPVAAGGRDEANVFVESPNASIGNGSVTIAPEFRTEDVARATQVQVRQVGSAGSLSLSKNSVAPSPADMVATSVPRRLPSVIDEERIFQFDDDGSDAATAPSTAARNGRAVVEKSADFTALTAAVSIGQLMAHDDISLQADASLSMMVPAGPAPQLPSPNAAMDPPSARLYETAAPTSPLLTVTPSSPRRRVGSRAVPQFDEMDRSDAGSDVMAAERQNAIDTRLGDHPAESRVMIPAEPVLRFAASPDKVKKKPRRKLTADDCSPKQFVAPVRRTAVADADAVAAIELELDELLGPA
jgi:hypothetical protein